jgi:hypothetical protein
MFLRDDSKHVARSRSIVRPDNNGHRRTPSPYVPNDAEHNILLANDGKVAARGIAEGGAPGRIRWFPRALGVNMQHSHDSVIARGDYVLSLPIPIRFAQNTVQACARLPEQNLTIHYVTRLTYEEHVRMERLGNEVPPAEQFNRVDNSPARELAGCRC